MKVQPHWKITTSKASNVQAFFFDSTGFIPLVLSFDFTKFFL